MLRFRPLVALAVLLPLSTLQFACATGTPAAETAESEGKYQIVLDREWPVGKPVNVTIVESEYNGSKVSAEGKLLKDEVVRQSSRFTGTRKKLSDSETSGWEYQVKSLTVTTPDGEKRTLFSEGDLIEGKPAGEDFAYTVGGESPPEEVHEVLLNLLGKKVKDRSTEEAFGTDQPQAVGGTWPINKELFIKELGDAMGLDPAKTNGQMRLVAVKEVEGLEVLEVESKIEAQDIKLPSVPEGATVKSSHANFQVVLLLPTDESLPMLSSVLTLDMGFVMEVPRKDGGVLLLEFESKREQQKNWHP